MIRREIVHAGGPTAHFEGQADWQPTKDGMIYVEQGMLHMTGQPPIKAERKYHWDNDLNIYFDDGRFFHRVPVDGGNAAHWCDPDQYDATYDFERWPEWSCTWKVRGPRKDYSLYSHYRRN